MPDTDNTIFIQPLGPIHTLEDGRIGVHLLLFEQPFCYREEDKNEQFPMGHLFITTPGDWQLLRRKVIPSDFTTSDYDTVELQDGNGEVRFRLLTFYKFYSMFSFLDDN